MSIAIGEPIENELNEKRKPSLDQDTKLTMATTSLTEQIASTPSQENQFEIYYKQYYMDSSKNSSINFDSYLQSSLKLISLFPSTANLNFKKQIEEEFECDKKKGFVTEIKNFLFKHGVDIDLNGELINVNHLFTKNEIAVNSLRNFAKELQDCCKVISNEQKSPLVPPSRVLESKNKLHEELKEKFSHEDEYVQRKIEDIIKEINTLREVLLE